MELQLGLAPPIGNSIIHEFELNKKKNSDFSADSSVEGIGSCLSSEDEDESNRCTTRKRRFDDAIEADRTLPLLLWNGYPNADDDEQVSRDRTFTINNDGRGGDCIMGWPPVNSYRKKLCHQSSNGRPAAQNSGGEVSGDGFSSMYVKVQMEGVVITRKVNLSFLEHHQSFETLTCSLISLFGRWQDRGDGYTLTYQDKEGDWLLAGDVPWRTFIHSIHRLKLLRN